LFGDLAKPNLPSLLTHLLSHCAGFSSCFGSTKGFLDSAKAFAKTSACSLLADFMAWARATANADKSFMLSFGSAYAGSVEAAGETTSGAESVPVFTSFVCLSVELDMWVAFFLPVITTGARDQFSFLICAGKGKQL